MTTIAYFDNCAIYYKRICNSSGGFLAFLNYTLTGDMRRFWYSVLKIIYCFYFIYVMIAL